MSIRRAWVLIIGSGIAGLFVALRAHERGLRPTIVTKGRLDDSNTRYAQGGIAAALGPDDSAALHFQDTVRAGAGIVDESAATRLTEEAPARIADLVRYGVPFDTVNGQITLGREAAHRRARILHAGGDATGLRIEETLRRRVLDGGIEAKERRVLRRLVVARDRTVVATVARDDGTDASEWSEGPVVLATGGAGHLYRESSNPSVATGDGIALSFRAGALIADMEFIQFHPTVFYREGAPRFLISEAVRGEGAVLRNAKGERFLRRTHPDAELAPRDIVSRAIKFELDRSGARCVYLDATGIPAERFQTRFPTIAQFLSAVALDPSTDMIPITPAAHYSIGGVATDLAGRTSLPGLLAVGEVAATGVHGANRLASNSLLEGLVFGEHVARQLADPRPGGPETPGTMREIPIPFGEGREEAGEMLETIHSVLWEQVGIIRNAQGLDEAAGTFEELTARAEPAGSKGLPGPGANATLTARLITEAARTRTESRGAHYRSDHPRPRARWKHHLGLVRTAPDPKNR